MATKKIMCFLNGKLRNEFEESIPKICWNKYEQHMCKIFFIVP